MPHECGGVHQGFRCGRSRLIEFAGQGERAVACGVQCCKRDSVDAGGGGADG